MSVQPIGAAFRTRRDRHRPKLRAGPTSNIRTGADNAVTLQPSVSVRLRNLTSWTIVSVRSENQLLTRKASEPADHFIDYGGHANVKRAGAGGGRRLSSACQMSATTGPLALAQASAALVNMVWPVSPPCEWPGGGMATLLGVAVVPRSSQSLSQGLAARREFASQRKKTGAGHAVALLFGEPRNSGQGGNSKSARLSAR